MVENGRKNAQQLQNASPDIIEAREQAATNPKWYKLTGEKFQGVTEKSLWNVKIAKFCFDEIYLAMMLGILWTKN